MELTKEQKLLQTVVQKAWEDINFKQELLVNPIVAIEKLIGQRISLPEGKTIVVCDQTDPSVVYINIPAEPNMDNMELNEEQLEAVAGGWDLNFLLNVFPSLKFSNE
ncbi:NHLP leader peptide family RiPP precursor [Tenacibaculum ovolyticum]|uniref:NHLP leader peptide family RiPP precursor n=1 Tax=Tenacibaculum ovolyticum TaxID=104270 RepID=UPI0022F3E8AC|nr:NHLP leader peptide family RiPP precursor [Tenacibaculum ovolyticum]WBX76783.1 NHLP leader peptide family RiPP precursor [Tenacibaculum ovolyticum]